MARNIFERGRSLSADEVRCGRGVEEYRVFPLLEGRHSNGDVSRALTEAQISGELPEGIDRADLGLAKLRTRGQYRF